MTGSAVLRTGDHAPVVLLGTPAVSRDVQSGEVTIALGYVARGGGRQAQAVTVTIRTLEWARDLLDAALDAGVVGVVQADMKAVTS